MSDKVPESSDESRFWKSLTAATLERLKKQGVAPAHISGESVKKLGGPTPRPELPVERAPGRRSEPAQGDLPRGSGRGPRGKRRKTAEQRERARARREERQLQRIRGRLAAQGVRPESAELRLIPREIWSACREILADLSGRACRVWLARQKNKAAVAAIRRAALEPVAGGATRRTWCDARARVICALGVGLLMLAVPTGRASAHANEVRGVTRGALCAMLASPFEPDRRPTLGALSGTSHNGTRVGYLISLEQAGFLRRYQMPGDRAPTAERFKNRRGELWASNRYQVLRMPRMGFPDFERLVGLCSEAAGVLKEKLERAPRAAAAPAAPES